MTKSGNLSSQHLRFMHWLHARVLGFSKTATGFVKQPEPRSIGSYARGLQLKAGNIMFAGHLVEAPDTVLWDIASPADGFTQEAHGFGWLDDLASVADKNSRKNFLTEAVLGESGVPKLINTIPAVFISNLLPFCLITNYAQYSIK